MKKILVFSLILIFVFSFTSIKGFCDDWNKSIMCAIDRGGEQPGVTSYLTVSFQNKIAFMMLYGVNDCTMIYDGVDSPQFGAIMLSSQSGARKTLGC